MRQQPTIVIKRIYEEPNEEDGYRILVDRLWPRGISKEGALIDEWTKDLAPSALLRKWYNHQPALWKEFGKLYRNELKENAYVPTFIDKHKDTGKLTLLYAGKDEKHTHAIILQEYLLKHFGK